MHWSSVFDQAAAVSTEASVALYSLGRSDLLRAATDEIVDRMRAWGVLTPGCTALEIGCGNGRVLHALAPEMDLAVGIDISLRMLGAARQRCTGIPTTVFIRSSGRDLAAFADALFDLVYAVDVFPYLVQSGLAARHVREAARVLTAGGSFLILNYSYRKDADADRAEIAQLAAECGLIVRRNGTSDFTLWDGETYLLQRPA
jgi:ubiquinone/menaquinone biosynthesis C-methylase UbiE